MTIKAENISLKIGENPIFGPMSFTVKDAQMVAITGVSGSGKTSLLNCLGLIQNLSSGGLWINGKNCTKVNENDKMDFWRNTAAFIYQDYGIIDEESVIYNITFSNRKTDGEKAKKYLQEVGLADKIKNRASALSGGEKQRLGIARALYKKAGILFADEPTASLDEDNREAVIDLFKRFVVEGGLVVLATHDEGLSRICDQVIAMR